MARKTRNSARRRSTPSARISGTAIIGRDAETSEPTDSPTGRNMRHLPRGFRGLQRRRTRPQESERNGRSLERRSSGQYPGNTLVVQRRKGINQNGLTYGPRVVFRSTSGLLASRSFCDRSTETDLCGANRPKSESPTAYHIVVIVSVSLARKRGSRRPVSSTRLLAVRRARSRISIRRLVWTCPSQSASLAVQA